MKKNARIDSLFVPASVKEITEETLKDANKVTKKTNENIKRLNEAAKELVCMIHEVSPAFRETEIATQKVEEAIMWATKGLNKSN